MAIFLLPLSGINLLIYCVQSRIISDRNDKDTKIFMGAREVYASMDTTHQQLTISKFRAE